MRSFLLIFHSKEDEIDYVMEKKGKMLLYSTAYLIIRFIGVILLLLAAITNQYSYDRFVTSLIGTVAHLVFHIIFWKFP